MTLPEKWAEDRLQQVDRLKHNLTRQQIRRYRVDLLPGLIRRLPALSQSCEACLQSAVALKDCLQLLEARTPDPPASLWQDCRSQIHLLVTHLEKNHGIVPPEHYTEQYMALGTALGLMLGTLTGHLAPRLMIGMLLGILLGTTRDRKAAGESRVI